MKKFLFVTVLSAMAVLSIIFAPAASSADNQGRTKFIGPWGGVDSVDGSEVLASISDNDDDGTLELLWHESRWFSCNCSDNAILTATGGTIEDRVLSFETAIISCFDMNNETDVSPVTFEANRKDNTIFSQNIVLHRIDSRR